MPDRPLVLMAVHAHPDDEATSTGGVLAKYAAEGIETILVTCTDGRCGDGPDGVKPEDSAHDAAAVIAMRQRELEASCAILGVTHLELLGYADSGMMGWATNDAPGAFWSTPVDEAAGRLAELMRTYRPDVVVTYDEFGFYGHPDHIQAHRITMAAVEATGLPAKVYWTTAPYSKIEEFAALLRDLGMGDQIPGSDAGTSDSDPSGAGAAGEDPPGAGDGERAEPTPKIGLPDDQVTTWVDTKAFGSAKFDALATHSSQSENIFFLHLGKERFTEMMGVEAFVRVRDTTDAPLPEDDLFAGLR